MGVLSGHGRAHICGSIEGFVAAVENSPCSRRTPPRGQWLGVLALQSGRSVVVMPPDSYSMINWTVINPQVRTAHESDCYAPATQGTPPDQPNPHRVDSLWRLR